MKKTVKAILLLFISVPVVSSSASANNETAEELQRKTSTDSLPTTPPLHSSSLSNPLPSPCDRQATPRVSNEATKLQITLLEVAKKEDDDVFKENLARILKIKQLDVLNTQLSLIARKDEKLAQRLYEAWSENLRKVISEKSEEIFKRYPKISDGSIKQVVVINADGSPGDLNRPGIALLVPKDPSQKTKQELIREVGSLNELQKRGIPTIRVIGSNTVESSIFPVSKNPDHVGVMTEYVPNAMRLEAKTPPRSTASNIDQLVLLNGILGLRVNTTEFGIAGALRQLPATKQQVVEKLRNPSFRKEFVEKASVLYENFNQVHQNTVKNGEVISDLQFLIRTDINRNNNGALVHDPLGIVSRNEMNSINPNSQQGRFLNETAAWTKSLRDFMLELKTNPEKAIHGISGTVGIPTGGFGKYFD